MNKLSLAVVLSGVGLRKGNMAIQTILSRFTSMKLYRWERGIRCYPAFLLYKNIGPMVQSIILCKDKNYYG
jgi:hypothetical protein